jgi:hypothetical protein
MMRQATGDLRAGTSTRVISVKKHNYVPEMSREKPLLGSGHRAAHQRHNEPHASLVHFETIKEAFHDNNASAVLVGDDTMKIEENQRLAESRWESVPWLCVIQGPSCIGK